MILDASVRDDNEQRVAFLDHHGFQPNGLETRYMVRSLQEAGPKLHFPKGFFVRPLAGTEEVEAYVAAHRAAFGTDQMTVAQRSAIIQQPAYRPELDLVAVAPTAPWRPSAYVLWMTLAMIKWTDHRARSASWEPALSSRAEDWAEPWSWLAWQLSSCGRG